MAVRLFLSPHLDDAILSCGGVMHRLSGQGERVIVVTVMAGEPPGEQFDSPVLRSIRSPWKDSENVFTTRRSEDAQAAQQLGAQVYHLAFTECAFRGAICGTGERVALYPQYDSPFLEINEADDARVSLLNMRLPFEDVTAIYAPLCVDDHVDHRLVRDWALVLTGSQDAPALRFYEEFPHSRSKAALQRAHNFYQRQLPALTMEQAVIPLDEGDVEAKLQAMRCYRSHLNVLWNDVAELDRISREYMLAVGGGTPAERYWRVV